MRRAIQPRSTGGLVVIADVPKGECPSCGGPCSGTLMQCGITVDTCAACIRAAGDGKGIKPVGLLAEAREQLGLSVSEAARAIGAYPGDLRLAEAGDPRVSKARAARFLAQIQAIGAEAKQA